METNFSQEEKTAVEAYLQESATFISQDQYVAGRLVFWKNAESLPSIRACSFRASDGRLYVPNSDDATFRQVLCEIGSEIKDANQWCSLIEKMSPHFRRAIKGFYPYMKAIEHFWHVPSLQDGVFEAFFDNSTTGRLEKIVMRDGSTLSIEDAGAGVKMSLR
ncbi:hypothetical protein [Chitinivorax sp. B]|uniref:hypothetical protein n=1 Tax=Chitinivorax sp. B TaxID=2502235 RepID=UPI0010F9FA85|nr:hypothetical protein [Chitinivorax sp. B]